MNKEINIEQLKEIADLLICKQICFLHKETSEMLYYPESQDLFIDEQDPWQDSKDKIDNDFDNYVKFEPMDSNTYYNVMVGFIEQVELEDLQDQLFNALNRKQPFRNFNFIIHNSKTHKQKWFDFLLDQHILWVKHQIM